MNKFYRIFFAPLQLTPYFFGVPMLVIAFLIGTHLAWWVQLVFIGYWLWFLNNWECNKYEIGAIIFIIVFVGFMIALIGGNVSYFIQTDDWPSFTVPLNIFKV